jgi:hypothetical protein
MEVRVPGRSMVVRDVQSRKAYPPRVLRVAGRVRDTILFLSGLLVGILESVSGAAVRAAPAARTVTGPGTPTTLPAALLPAALPFSNPIPKGRGYRSVTVNCTISE